MKKENRNKGLIKNCRPNSLLNTDLKILSKALAAKLKAVLTSLIAFKQTVCVQNRYIGEAGRWISDILVISDKLSIDCYLVTLSIKKSFGLPWS